MTEEMRVLWAWGPLHVTPYSLMMTLGAVVSVFILLLTMQRKGHTRETAIHLSLVSILGAVLGGHLIYCLCMAPMLESDYGGISLVWEFFRGGYTLYGAVFGVLAAVCWSARVRGERVLGLLDVLTPAASWMLMVGRLAERFTNQGIGMMVEQPWLQRLPFAVCTYMDEEWSEWHVPVFLWEALLGLLLFCLSVSMLKKARKEGRTALVFLTVLSAVQVLLEQMRQDDCIRFGFVRFTQLAALAVMMGCLAWECRGGELRSILVRWARLGFCALIVVFVEFAFEKPQFNIWLFASMAAAWLAFIPGLDGTKPKLWQWIAEAVMLAGGIAVIATLGHDYEFEGLMLYAVMACALFGMAQTILCSRARENR